MGGGGGDWGLAGARVNDFFFHNESKSKIFFILWGVGDGGGWGCWWGQGGGGWVGEAWVSDFFKYESKFKINKKNVVFFTMNPILIFFFRWGGGGARVSEIF